MNQENKPESAYMPTVMKHLVESGMAISRMLSSTVPPEIALKSSKEANAKIVLEFSEEGFQFSADGLVIEMPSEYGEPSEVDGLLATGKFLIAHAEFCLLQYQAHKICQEIVRMVQEGTIELEPGAEISPALMTLIMQNASANAFEEHQVSRPEGETLQ